MTLQKIATLLGNSDELKGLSARTRRLRELQTLYFGSAPRELAEVEAEMARRPRPAASR